MKRNRNQTQMQGDNESDRDFILEDEILFGNDDDALLENPAVEDFLFDDSGFGF
ncbi:hypothetical protein [Candidatus Allofournierella merdipullorum]|uniref:hypothetical protein n=1 Tax=Candidatus Allofournierella merdipullorum TaxID=2838595 RepID=UPI00374E254F